MFIYQDLVYFCLYNNTSANKLYETILVVDDNEGVRKSLTGLLEAEDYTVDTAASGSEAIEKSRKLHYDLALLDIRLPDMEGTRLLKEMEMGKPRMKTIVITGYATLENAVEALNLGADAYLEKPIDQEKLLKIIREKLRERQSEHQKATVEEK